jgi:hypothetical protein
MEKNKIVCSQNYSSPIPEEYINHPYGYIEGNILFHQNYLNLNTYILLSNRFHIDFKGTELISDVSAPSIGIYWINDDNIYLGATSEEYPDKVIKDGKKLYFAISHREIWWIANKTGTMDVLLSDIGLNETDLYRGKAVKEDSKYVIEISSRLKNSGVKNKILKYFGLTHLYDGNLVDFKYIN